MLKYNILWVVAVSYYTLLKTEEWRRIKCHITDKKLFHVQGEVFIIIFVFVRNLFFVCQKFGPGNQDFGDNNAKEEQGSSLMARIVANFPLVGYYQSSITRK